MICKDRLFSCLWMLFGVFDPHAFGMETVSVMKGDSVTLHSDVTVIQKYHSIKWTFGSPKTQIAKLYKQRIIIDYNENFGDRLQLDSQTGSLTISNTRTSDSGLYVLTQYNKLSWPSFKKFNVTVYDHAQCCSLTEAVIRLVISALVGVAIVAVVVYDIRSSRAQQPNQIHT